MGPSRLGSGPGCATDILLFLSLVSVTPPGKWEALELSDFPWGPGRSDFQCSLLSE